MPRGTWSIVNSIFNFARRLHYLVAAVQPGIGGEAASISFFILSSSSSSPILLADSLRRWCVYRIRSFPHLHSTGTRSLCSSSPSSTSTSSTNYDGETQRRQRLSPSSRPTSTLNICRRRVRFADGIFISLNHASKCAFTSIRARLSCSRSSSSSSTRSKTSTFISRLVVR